MKYIRTLVARGWGLFGTLLAASLTLVAALFPRRTGLVWLVARGWGFSTIALSSGQPFKTRGTDALKKMSGAIVMSNHRSILDPPAIIASSPQPLNIIAKHTLFWIPVFGQGMWAAGHISINRSNREKSFESIERAAASIREGKNVLVFPEGKRSTEADLSPFKKGGFVLAIKSGVPIIPIGIAGTDHNVPKGFGIVSKGPITLVVGEPIPTSQWTLDTKGALSDLVGERIDALRAEAVAWREQLLCGED